MGNSQTSISPEHGSSGGLRSSVRKSSGISNFFHVNSLPSFKRHNSTDETNNLSNGDLTSKEKALNRINSYTQVSLNCFSLFYVTLYTDFNY